jgi:hypothetical protein
MIQVELTKNLPFKIKIPKQTVFLLSSKIEHAKRPKQLQEIIRKARTFRKQLPRKPYGIISTVVS